MMFRFNASKLFTYENSLLVMLGITFGVVFMDRLAVNFLAPFIVRDLRLSSTQVGLLAAALSLTWALSNIIFGRISDVIGQRKWLLVGAIVVFSICSFTSGLATSFAMLIAARLFMGLAEGPVPPLVLTLMAQSSSPRRLGLNSGLIINGFLSLFALVLGPVVLIGLAQSFNWRVAFWLAAVPGLLMALLIAKFARDPRIVSTVATTTDPSRPKRENYFHILARRNIVLCTLLACFTMAILMVGTAFSALYLVNERHLAPTQASLLLGAQGVANMLSFLVPALSDRIGRKPAVILFGFLSMTAPLAMLYFHGSLWGLGALLFLGGFSLGVTTLLIIVIPAETVPMHQLGTVSGFIPGVAELIGSVGGPALAGRAADLVSPSAPFLIMIGCSLAVGLLALGLKESLGVSPEAIGVVPLSTAQSHA
jgi:MFS family permease